MNNNLTFVIISIIYLTNKPLSYSKTRSVFSPEERAKQTKKTILSIREKVPKAKIILCESGLQKNLPENINILADEYFYIGDKKIIRYACDSPFKGLGEIFSILQLRKKINPTSDYFKISGRYYLNEDFYINDWKNGDFIFKFRNSNYFSTVLYKFKGSAFKTLQRALIFSIPFCLFNRSIEFMIFRFIPSKKIQKIQKIGVSGHIAVGGELFSE
jgi:hypothetical protein